LVVVVARSIENVAKVVDIAAVVRVDGPSCHWVVFDPTGAATVSGVAAAEVVGVLQAVVLVVAAELETGSGLVSEHVIVTADIGFVVVVIVIAVVVIAIVAVLVATALIAALTVVNSVVAKEKVVALVCRV
jgi:hypothetical protein